MLFGIPLFSYSLGMCSLLLWHAFISVSQNIPTIWISIVALSCKFSTSTFMSYSPEWLLSAFRMKMIVSFSVVRMLIWFLSIGEPFFCHDTFALGLPCKKSGNNLYMVLGEKRVGKKTGLFPIFPQWEVKTIPKETKNSFLKHTASEMQSY